MDIISLTPTAITKFIEAKGNALGFELKVLGGGCAGLQYDLQKVTELSEELKAQLITLELTFYFKPVMIPYIKGITIDYSTDLIGGGFKFINPNSSSSCGCGTSFGI